jgi:UDP-N-acetylmuramate dehydrogenase
LYIEVGSANDLRAIAEQTKGHQYPITALGKGSNLLVADSGFDGLVLRLGVSFASIAIEKNGVIAGAASNLPVVARKTVASGLTGFEWAVGVPGSIGGAVRMNAGGHGSDMSMSVERVEVVNLSSGEQYSYNRNELKFGYRESSISDEELVSEVVLNLEIGDVEESEIQLSEIVRWRIENQPGGQNAGSVFTNPSGDSAGRLIDAAGCKGLRIGSAHVSEKHANFIQVDTGGSSGDVLALIKEIQNRVIVHFGVELTPENHFLGFD